MTTSVVTARRWALQARGRLVIALVLLVGIYFLVAFGEQAWKARQLQGEVAERQQVIAQLQARHDALQQQVTEFSSSDTYLAYVERSARRDLNLSNSGETVLLVRWKDAPPPPATPAKASATHAAHEANWQRWLDLFHVP